MPAAQDFDRPLLSVVVPFYNVAAYLEAALASVRDQLLTTIEVVMVDDGSIDGSGDIARSFADTDPRFRLVSQENQGIGAARNVGVAHARGTYLAFVDGDDLIAPRAYTLMVGSLESTGSDIAAGNAYRFSTGQGVRQSWTHREAFAHTIIGTTLERTPELTRDRMVWNKVYRRSFWDASDLVFPSMRYEDYVVALKAYLQASAIDVFADHVYFWRDRESGDSITQQTSTADNAVDRYRGAELVLDVLDSHSASPEVRRRVHAYFTHVDVVALAAAMIAVDPQDRALTEDLAQRLALRLKPGKDHGVPRIARLIHQRLVAGDMESVRTLSRWRLSGNPRALASDLMQHPNVRVVFGAADAVLTARAPQNPLKARALNSLLKTAMWHGHMLHLEIATTLRPQFAHRATVKAELISGATSVPVEISTTPTSSGIEAHLMLDTARLEGLPHTWQQAHIWIEMRWLSLTWRGQITFSPETLPGIRQISEHDWIQLRGFGGSLGFERLRDPIVIDHIEFTDGSFRLVAASGGSQNSLFVQRPAPSPRLSLNSTEDGAALNAESVVRDDPADNVITKIAERPIVGFPAVSSTSTLRRENADEASASTTNPPAALSEYTYLAGTGADAIVGERRVVLTREARGMLVARQEPLDHSTSSPMP